MHYLKNALTLSIFSFFLVLNISAQDVSWEDLKDDPTSTFEEIQQAFHAEWDGQEYERGYGYKQFYRWENFWENRLMPDGSFPDFSYAFKSYKLYKSEHPTSFDNSKMFGNWLPLGPFSFTNTSSWSSGTGRVNVVVQDPNDANTIYVGAPAGGIWKSTDAGSTWTPLGDSFSVIGISGIAVDPSNSNIIYVATGDADAGDTYDIGIFKSLDGGSTWAQAGPNFGQCNKILIDPNTTSTVWASGDNGLYKSVDSGGSWTQMLGGNIKDMALKPGDPQTVYGVTSTNLYYTTNGGTSFNTATGLPGGTNRLVIGVTPANSSYVYIVAANGGWAYQGVYRSTNSGVSFTARNTTTDIFSGSGQAWYDMAVTVSDTDENTLIFGVLNLWRSTDGGAAWTEINSWSNPFGASFTHADIHYLNYYNGNLYCGSDGGIYKSTNDGTTFTDLSAGVQIGQFYTIGASPNDVNVLAGGLQDNGGFAWTGGSWKAYYGADGMGSAVNHSNSNNIFGNIQFGPLYRTTNGGTSYIGEGSGGGQSGNWVTPLQWDENNNRIITGYDDLFAYNNGSDTWTQLSTFNFPGKLRHIEIFEGNATTFFTSTTNNVYKTVNGGTTMTDITGTLPGSITSIEVNQADVDEIWVTVGGWSAGTKVYTTTNGGTTWTNLSGTLPNLPTNVVRYDGTNDGLYLGMDIGVYYRDDILGDWVPFNDNLPNVIVNDIELNEANNKVRIGTYGRGVWESGTYNVPVINDNITINQILAPTGNLCTTSVSPQLEIRNVGGNTVTSFDVDYDIDGGATLTQSWSGTLNVGAAVIINLPAIAVSAGGHTFNALATNPNGNTDGDNSNNSGSSGFVIADTWVDVGIVTDRYGNETTWEIYDAGLNLVANGGPYSDTGVNGEYPQPDEQVCLTSGVCYDFVINDSWGDGMCCAYGNGYYEVKDTQGNVLITGAPTGASETQNFCPPLPPVGTTYYSQGSGNMSDAIWSTSVSGTGAVASFDCTTNIVIQNTHAVTNNLGNFSCLDFTVENGGSFNLQIGEWVMSLCGDLTNDGTFTPIDSKVSFSGSIPQTLGGTTDTEYYDIQLNNAQGLQVMSAQSLTNGLDLQNGTFDANGNVFTFKSTSVTTGRLLQIQSGADYIGDMTAERNVGSFSQGWRMLGAPITGATLADFNDDIATTGFTGSDYPAYGFNSIRTYDETVTTGDMHDGFVGATDITNGLASGNGMFAYFGGTPLLIDFVGPPFKGALVTPVIHTVSGTGLINDGWILVANPYQCTIDWDAASGWTKTNIDGTIHSYNNDTQQWATYTTGGVMVNGGSRYIAPSQGYWIKTTAAGGAFGLDENVKIDHFVDFIRAEEEFLASVIKFSIHGETYSDETALAIRGGATNGIDTQYDGYKQFGETELVPSITMAVSDGEMLRDLAINSYESLAAGMSIPINVLVPEEGEYGFATNDFDVNAIGACLILEDLVTGTSQTIEPGMYFTINVSPEDDANRFMIHVTEALASITSDATCPGEEDGEVTLSISSDEAFSYSLFDEGNNLVSSLEWVIGDITFAGLIAGNYYVTVNGEDLECGSITKSFTINQPEPIEGELVQWQQDACNAEGNGSFTVSLSQNEWTVIVSKNGEFFGEYQISGAEFSLENLDGALYEINAISNCGTIHKTADIIDPREVFADFIAPTQVNLSNGGEVEITSTSSATAHSLNWEISDGYMNVGESITYAFFQTGIYEVNLYASNSTCSDTHTDWIEVIDTVVEIDEEQEFNGIELINANNQVTVYLNTPENLGTVIVSMYDASGRLTVSEELKNTQNQKVDFSTTKQSQGMYTVVVKTTDKVVFFEKIVISK